MPSELVPWEAVPPRSLTEALTAQFYAWELRGRGWQLWEAPVELEPPFRPFYVFLPIAAGTIPDDARKPTVLSRIAENVKALFKASDAQDHADMPLATQHWESGPEPAPDDEPVIELRTTVPLSLGVTTDQAEQTLLSVAYTGSPVAFEVVGTATEIWFQFACRERDSELVTQQLAAHFPDATVEATADALSKCWIEDQHSEPVLIDFGLSDEFMRPLRLFRDFGADPLAAVVGALSGLRAGEVGVLQVLFEGTRHPWVESVLRAVSDERGGSFFADAPEMLSLAREKVARPLFGAVVRIGAKSPDPERAWQIARFLGGALKQFSRPPSNELIPLSDAGYPADEHEADLLFRRSHRSGMLLSSAELVALAHLPSSSVRGEKLLRRTRKTKAAPETVVGHGCVLGENNHGGTSRTVTLSTNQRLRHTYLIGGTGTGKSHLLTSLIIQDLNAGRGIAVLDPHGDLIDQVLSYVPEERANQVIVFDPADEERPVGFNLLDAHSPLEKNLLASDMTSVFRRLSTSWGDQMTAVLSNAVLAFLESPDGGTLAELRRFLVDAAYRRRFLETVQDPEIVFFWQKEFPLLAGRPQAPILTRLNAFLRHPLVRYVVAQPKARVDLGQVLRDGGVFLGKLAQGAIGEENASLLGSLLVSKFQQLAVARQAEHPDERRPFMLYIDEFHNFATPSVAQLLSGARKYGLGLVLAHQDLDQLSGQEGLLNAVLTNPAVRVCFRVGERDARKLEEGFSSFGREDLQTLGTGEAVCRVERSDWDFNLKTYPLPSLDPELAAARREEVVAQSRESYGIPREELEARLQTLREAPETAPEAQELPERVSEAEGKQKVSRGPGMARKGTHGRRPGAAVEEPPALPSLGRGGPEHTYLQNLIKRWAESRGWRATIEKEVLDGAGSVDVALERGKLSLACEISVSTGAEHEVKNVKKCLEAGFGEVAVVSTASKSLDSVREWVNAELSATDARRVYAVTPDGLFSLLADREAEAAATEGNVRGYKVKTRYRAVEEEGQEARRQAVSQVILKALKRLRGK